MKKYPWAKGVPFDRGSQIPVNFGPLAYFTVGNVTNFPKQATGSITVELPKDSTWSDPTPIFNPDGEILAFQIKWKTASEEVHGLGIQARFDVVTTYREDIPFNIHCSANHIIITRAADDKD